MPYLTKSTSTDFPFGLIPIETTEMMMMMSESVDDGGLDEAELELGLGIRGSCWSENNNNNNNNKARSRRTTSSIMASSSECSSTSSSSLLLLRRSADDVPAAGLFKRTSADFASSHSATDAALNSLNHVVVGWPPVRRAYRSIGYYVPSIPHFDSIFRPSKSTGIFISNLLQSNNDSGDANAPQCHTASPYVKVNMDGYPIGRKVDLTSLNSYETLAHKLKDMFFNSQPSTSLFVGSDQEKNMTADSRETASMLLMGSSEFVLTFEDREGDWMLVGDVPWRMFCDSVKRLRIMRTSGANMPVII